jgi:hypothetical protein
MVGKRLVDIKRESAKTLTLNFEDDGTPIKEIFTLDHTLVLITHKGVYEARLTDHIDPKRGNSHLPFMVQQRVLEIGIDSELIGRILLTAKNLFREGEGFFPSSIDLKRAMSLAYEILKEMYVMDAVTKQYKRDEERAIEIAKNSKGSFAIPSIGDVKSRCKTFFQKGDHACQALWDIARLFYPELKEKGHLKTLHNFITGKYGDDDDFAKFLERALPFLKMVRNGRDCLDHRQKGVIVTDFALHSNGKITSPAIEIKFRGTSQPPIPVADCMSLTVQSMLNVVEDFMAFLCSKHAQPLGGFSIQVGIIPEDRRRSKFIRYGYWTNLGGNFAPIV